MRKTFHTRILLRKTNGPSSKRLVILYSQYSRIYSLFHKTLPKLILQMHWISVRFYEMGDIHNMQYAARKRKKESGRASAASIWYLFRQLYAAFCALFSFCCCFYHFYTFSVSFFREHVKKLAFLADASAKDLSDFM